MVTGQQRCEEASLQVEGQYLAALAGASWVAVVQLGRDPDSVVGSVSVAELPLLAGEAVAALEALLLVSGLAVTGVPESAGPTEPPSVLTPAPACQLSPCAGL